MADHHDHSSDDFVHGEMDVHQQQHSFDLFVNMTKWGCLFLAVALTFLVILTCTAMGWLTAAIVAIVVAVIGWFMLQKKPDAAH